MFLLGSVVSEDVQPGEKDTAHRRLFQDDLSDSLSPTIQQANFASRRRIQSPSLGEALEMIGRLQGLLGNTASGLETALSKHKDMEEQIQSLSVSLSATRQKLADAEKTQYQLFAMYTVPFLTTFDAAEDLTGFSMADLEKYFFSAIRSTQGRAGLLSKEDHIIIYLAVAQMMPITSIARRFSIQEQEIRRFIVSSQKFLDDFYVNTIRLPSIQDLHRANKSCVVNEEYSLFAFMICDGSGTVIYKPMSFPFAREMYTHHKGHHSFRFTVVVNALGKPIWVSKMYSGNIDDLTALRVITSMFSNRTFMEDVRLTYPDAKIEDKLVFAADKGYVYFNTTNVSDNDVKAGLLIGKSEDNFPIGVHITESGTVNVESEEALSSFKEKRPFVRFSSTLAPSRSVVERFFCRVKSMLPILAGPAYLSQAEMLSGYLRTACYIIARMIDEGDLVLARTVPQGDGPAAASAGDDGLQGRNVDEENDEVSIQRFEVDGVQGFMVD